MRSVKSKLFIGFASVIFIILLMLSFFSTQLFYINQENERIEQINSIITELTLFIEKNSDQKIQELDRFINLKNQFLIILKDEEILFTNQTRYKTDIILEEALEEYKEYFDDDHYEYREKYRDDHRRDHYKGQRDKKDDDYIILYELFEKNNSSYEIYTGIDEVLIDRHMDDIVFGIVVLNIVIFFVLLILGYVLIGKTIKPLKQILEELQVLQKGSDLSKRLQVLQTNDEFEQITNSLNSLLNNIENSVQNIKQFSSDASHELKTPLTVIQGEIEFIKNKNSSKEELQTVLSKVDKEQKKLQEIIKSFLLLSKLDKEVLKNKKASLDKVVFESIENNLEKIESKNLELKLDIQEDLYINFDEKYLFIVVNNLISNATKYTNNGYIKVSAKKENSNIYLEVCDTGLGIDVQDLDKIFERFYRVDKARSSFRDGVGLGLSIVKKICERFNSTILVNSTINKGSCFKIKF
jgi:signal transduction histidine kinase